MLHTRCTLTPRQMPSCVVSAVPRDPEALIAAWIAALVAATRDRFPYSRADGICSSYYHNQSPRSGRWHRAWGGAQRNPRTRCGKYSKPAERPKEESSRSTFVLEPLSAASRALRIFGLTRLYAIGRSADFDCFQRLVHLSHFLDFTYDSPRSLNHVVLIR